MSDYQYDIFISYSRTDDDWIRWTREIFAKTLTTLLQPLLAANVRIFIDNQIETGGNWPDKLLYAHASSRMMIPILSRAYFSSNWCRLELALMLERERLYGYGMAKNKNSLIVPFVIDDGDSFPPEIQAIQSVKIHKFANPFIRPGSSRHFDFAEELKGTCPRIASIIQAAPPYDPSLEKRSFLTFEKEFKIASQTHKKVPGLILPKIT